MTTSVRLRSAGTRSGAAAVVALALGSTVLAGASAAVAAPVPGDNGDVKTHNVGTAFDDQRDEPKVCAFYLDAFNFDTVEKVTWSIVPQPAKTPPEPSLSGSITLATGTGHTGEYTLPDGMYKLTWNFEGENGAGKHKVFKVECPPGTTTGGNTTGGNTTGGNTTGGGPPIGPVGAGGGGAAGTGSSPMFGGGAGAALAAGAVGAAGLILVRRSRRRADDAS